MFAIEHLVDRPPDEWLEAESARAAPNSATIPWLHTADGAERLAKACAAAGANLVALDDNPIDAHLDGPPGSAARRRGAARTRNRRRRAPTTSSTRIRDEIGKLRADALVVSDPQAVAWTFNIRGADVPHTPLALAFAIVPMEGRPALYVDGRKLDNDVRHALEELADVRTPAGLDARSRRARQGASTACGSTRRAPPTR